MTDLAAYLRPRARGTWKLALLLAMLGGGAATLLGLAVQQQQDLARQQARLERLQQRLVAAAPAVPTNGIDETQKAWSALQQERDFAWRDVFAAIEATSNPEIALLTFEPDKRNRVIVLSGEAKTPAALLVYLHALAAQPLLRHVYLQHQEPIAGERLQTIGFEIHAALRE